MIHKPKSWLWWFAFPFAHDNYTTLWETIYYPKRVGGVPLNIRAHEEIHSAQQKAWGKWALPFWVFAYLFLLPFFWNPFRWKWEFEAYTKGTRLSEDEARKRLRSFKKGFLLG